MKIIQFEILKKKIFKNKYHFIFFHFQTKEETEGGFFNSVNNFWTDNFSWDYGKFSPKNILVPSDQKLQRDKERKGEGLEEKTDNVGNLENEVFNENFGVS